MNRTAQLLQRWQDDSLSEAELRELKEILRTSAGRFALAQEFETIAAIAEEFKNAVEASKCGLAALDLTSDSVQSPPSRSGSGSGDRPPVEPAGPRDGRRTSGTREPRWSRILPRWVLNRPQQAAAVLAFALACLAGALFVLPDEPWQAKLARVKGQVELVRDGQVLRAEPGLTLQTGDMIRTSRGAEAIVQDEKDATFFALKQESSVRLFSNHWGKRLELTHGSLEAEVAPQPRFHPMMVTTPQARTTMLGTRFLLRATNEMTRLDVIEGLVRMNGRSKEDGSIEVSTAHSAEAAPSLELRAVAQDVIVMNFGPEGVRLPPGVLNDSGVEFSPSRGYGWEGPKEAGVIPGEFIEFQGRFTPAPRGRNAGVRIAHMGRFDALHASHVQAGWLSYTQSWKMRLAPGRYIVTVCAGDSDGPQGPLHVNVQGRQVIDGVFTAGGEFAEIHDIPVEVTEDGFLKLVVGGYRGKEKMPDGSSDTTLNFILVKRAANASLVRN